MNRTTKMVMLLALAGLAACGSDDAPATIDANTPETFTVTLAGTGYTPHNAATVYGVLHDSTGAEVATDSAVVAAGAFTLDFGDVAEDGATYTIGWWADINGNTTCEAAPTDHVWQFAVPAVSADVSHTHAHATDFAACL